MKKTVSIVVLFALLLGTAWAGLGSDKAMYVGGTLNQIKENSEGKVSATNPTVFTFTSKQGSDSIPFDHVNDLEYDQKAAAAGATKSAVDPYNPPASNGSGRGPNHTIPVPTKPVLNRCCVGQVSITNQTYLRGELWRRPNL